MKKMVFKAVVLTALMAGFSGVVFAAESKPADKGSVAASPAMPSAPTQTKTVPVVPSAPTIPAAAQIRIGYVDMGKLTAESELGKSSFAQIKAKQEKFQKEFLGRRTRIEKQNAALQGTFAKLSPEERAARSKEFQKKGKALQKKFEALQKDAMQADKQLQALQAELDKNFGTLVEKVAADYGKANGLTLVLVKRTMLYMASGIDLKDATDGIIKQMNAEGQKK